MINRIKKLFYKHYTDDIQYFISSSKFKIIYQFILFSTGFLIIWLFANTVSSEFYGIYLYILSIESFFSFLSFSGIAGSIQQSVASGYEHFYISGIKVMFKYSFFGSIAIFLFSIYYLLFLDVQISVLISLYIIGLFFPFSSVFSVYHFYLEGKLQFKKDLFFRLLYLIIQNSLILLLIFITQNLILHFLLINIFSLIINTSITGYCVKAVNTEIVIVEKEKRALKYGLFLTKIGLLGTISVSINNILIGTLFNPATLAFYAIGIVIPNSLLKLFRPSLSTLLSKYSKKEAKIGKSFIIFIILLSNLLFLGVIISLPLFMEILFPDYLDSIIYGLLYALLILIVPITTTFGYYFRGKTDIKSLRSIILYPNLFKFVFLVPFLYFFGIIGIIFSEYLLWIIRLIFSLISLKRKDLL